MRTPSHRPSFSSLHTLILWIGILACGPVLAAMEWPQEVTAPEGIIVVYQPQPESLQGNVLTSRAAISLELTDKEEPIFGAMWLTARIDTDRDAGTALVRDVTVAKVRWPDSNDAQEQRFTAIVEAAVPEAGFEISLERLSASLETAKVERNSLDNLKHEPPAIEFSQELAVLLTYDGEPRFSEVDGSPYERALNTPFLVVHNTDSGEYFLGSGDFWYQAKKPLGPWLETRNPPADLLQMIGSEAPGPDAGKAPAIRVSTTPTELISSDGKANWESLQGGQILYVENTETPWLRDLDSGNMYVLLSGRWYRAKTEDGPWTFVRADELPAGFTEIPPASDIGGLRVSVAGTEEAEEAMLDAAIPQTTAIKRSEASLQVEYDGSPKFESIAGTEVAYAVNTGSQVLKVGGRYYAVDEGVWFVSDAPTGPWVVADSIPQDEIAKIPPSSPVYNTTHVHIYDSSPEVVYVGYTPGYMWSFPYYGVPVYGTGWHYPPYWGRYYYPRPPTWGFHVGYNPWTGWNFGVSWSNGFFRMGMGWGGGYGGGYRPGGWYGGGHRGPVVINTGDINIGNNINIGNRNEIKNHFGDNKLGGKDRDNLGGRNIYNRDENRTRNASSELVNRDMKQARANTNRANNVYADRDGNVARRKDDAWETRDQGQWKRDDKVAAASADSRPADNRPANSDQKARDAATTATPEQRQQASQRAQNSGYQAPSKDATRDANKNTSKPTQSYQQQNNRQDLNRAHHARSTGAARERSRPARAQQSRRR